MQSERQGRTQRVNGEQIRHLAEAWLSQPALFQAPGVHPLVELTGRLLLEQITHDLDGAESEEFYAGYLRAKVDTLNLLVGSGGGLHGRGPLCRPRRVPGAGGPKVKRDYRPGLTATLFLCAALGTAFGLLCCALRGLP